MPSGAADPRSLSSQVHGGPRQVPTAFAPLPAGGQVPAAFAQLPAGGQVPAAFTQLPAGSQVPAAFTQPPADQERKLGDRRRPDTVLVLTINYAN